MSLGGSSVLMLGVRTLDAKRQESNQEVRNKRPAKEESGKVVGANCREKLIHRTVTISTASAALDS